MTHEDSQIRACCVQAHALVAMTFSGCEVRLAGKVAHAGALMARRIAFELVMADAFYAFTPSELMTVPDDVVDDVRHHVMRARGKFTKVAHGLSQSVH